MSKHEQIDTTQQSDSLAPGSEALVPEMPSLKQPSRDSLPVIDGVRLVSSARFVADILSLPEGVNPRDVTGFVEGEIEHLSLLPLDAVAWGYLVDKGLGDGQLLAYAGLRDQVQFAGDDSLFAVLPFFSCMCGLKWRRTTWVVLQEPDCLTLLRFRPRASIPDYVQSRFIGTEDSAAADIWDIRQSLIESVPREEGDEELAGFIRCAGMRVKGGRRAQFMLQQQVEPDKGWKQWSTGKLGPEAVLLAADIREGSFLDDERQRRNNLRQLRTVVRVAALLALLLGAWQVQYILSERELEEKSELVEGRRELVEALQEKEAMIRSTARLADLPLEAFDWLMAMNHVRTETVSFSTATFERDGQISVSGEAPSVAAVNQYVQALRDTGQYTALDVRDMQSTQRGVNFTLALQMQPGVRGLVQGEHTSQ